LGLRRRKGRERKGRFMPPYSTAIYVPGIDTKKYKISLIILSLESFVIV